VKEVQITPTSLGFRPVNPLRFKVGHLSPLSMTYRANYPLRVVWEANGCFVTGFGPRRLPQFATQEPRPV
jgi:hypothetical protein